MDTPRDTSDAMRSSPLIDLDQRSREIFRRIVDGYLTNGEPLGSRNIARVMSSALSPASVRNVMSDLESAGLIYAPHTSAGRLPTEMGLRFFVDAMLEVGDVAPADRERIEAQMKIAASQRNFDTTMSEASVLLSGLSRGAGVVVTTKVDTRLKHVEFVRLDTDRALVVLVSEDGSVENRMVNLPKGLPASALTEATNVLNARVVGRTLRELKSETEAYNQSLNNELDDLTARLITAGLATMSGTDTDRQLIVRGQANLLEDVNAQGDLDRIRSLFSDLETQKDVIELLSRAETGEGVRIFIGSENKLFSLSGSSLVAAPFRDAQQRIIGVVGVIGPTRLNYGRIVPMVDYTARVMSRLIEGGG
jgi:heat-inducible transcriptional repressor